MIVDNMDIMGWTLGMGWDGTDHQKRKRDNANVAVAGSEANDFLNGTSVFMCYGTRIRSVFD